MQTYPLCPGTYNEKQRETNFTMGKDNGISVEAAHLLAFGCYGNMLIVRATSLTSVRVTMQEVLRTVHH